ncbi:MAG: Gfo/Idh/MocA family oxidoreductase [Burkholderiales bacterium]|nr:Gfo/Idh/MocA family oxidoreductase [Burkholderiales bacterium]
MLKTAIYGLGRWGNRLTEAVQNSTKIRFVKGVSRDPSRHAEYSEKYGIPVTSYEEVLKDPQIDAVVLATPHSKHHEQIVAAAKAGKHVYVEKPLTLTRATAEQAVDACRKAGVTLSIGFNRRHAPSFVEMRKRIAAGAIGEVLHVEAHFSGPTGYGLKPGIWRSTRVEAPGGGMTARGIHTLDALIQIAGPVSEVYAHSDRRKLPAAIDMDDTTTMLLKFANGTTGSLSTLFVTAEYWRVQAFGTKGWLEMRGDTDLTFLGLEGKPEKIPLQAVDKEQLTLEAFADAVAAKTPFAVPPEQAINGIAVLEAIEPSARSGKPVAIR